MDDTKGFEVRVTPNDDSPGSTLVVTHDGVVILSESDVMEPEDACFTRDLKWIPDAIRRAYKLGRVDMADELIRGFAKGD